MFDHSFARICPGYRMDRPVIETSASLNWMSFSSMNSRRYMSVWQSAQILAVAVFVSGCASQGPLMPPSLQLPKPVERLTAERVGDVVTLSWVTPATTTDGAKIKGAMVARVCVDGQPTASPGIGTAPGKPGKHGKKASPAALSQSCNAVLQLPVTPGASKASAPLPAGLASGPPRAIAYAIELVSAKGKSAGPSAPVLLAGGAAPQATGPLQISGRRASVAIEWQPDLTHGTAVELKRTLIATPAGAVGDAPKGKQPKSAMPFSSTAKEPTKEVVLRVDPSAKDVGGTIDTTVRDGDTYTYVAQRVATLTFGGQTLELRSLPSPVVTFAYRDVFPPKAPTGLVLIPGGGFGEPPAIDLSWDASFEPDVIGYNIYRSIGAAFDKLNSEPIAVPAFRDTHVQPGQQYSYRVTAIDKRQNESAPGATATETLRK